MSLAQRHLQPELMDQPGLDQRLHIDALCGLAKVNMISGIAASLWKRIRPLATQAKSEPLRVLDIACGGGDTAISLAQRARRAKLAVEIAGCDISPTAVSFAKQSAAAAQLPVEFFTSDVVNDPLPSGFDVICCSLFLHHLEVNQAVRVLQEMKRATGRTLLVSDLSRDRLGYVLAWCGIRLLTRSRICHVDGPLSVSAAFTRREMQGLAEEAGLHGATLQYQWPQRQLLQWSIA